MEYTKALEALKALQDFKRLLQKLEPAFAEKQKRNLKSIEAELLRELDKNC